MERIIGGEKKIMKKCIASKDGIGQNVIGFGTTCNGYSDKCSLKPHYDILQQTAKNVQKSIKNILGIKGEGE